MKKDIKKTTKKKKKKYKKEYTIKDMIVTMIISILIGTILTFGVITILCGGKNIIFLSQKLNKFLDTYETITTNYYEDLDEDALIDGAISGMLANVNDNYTIYSNSEVTLEFDDLVNGTYEGIGCAIREEDKEIKIVTVYENSPAAKSGIKENDTILTVDGEDAITMGATKIAEYIKTKKEKATTLEILRDNEQQTIVVTRGKVDNPSVTSEIYEKNDKKIGYLDISIFASNTKEQFKNKLISLEESGISGLVIDVRGNNGGYLTTVVDIINMILPKGDIIYQTKKNNKIEKFKDQTKEKREYPIAVLINSGSASASEILAAAIKESYNGFVVGTTSFGKGTVQQVKKMKDGSMIKYTTENWLSPKGNWINEIGVEPTDEVQLNDEYYENPTTENDNQLQKALELVSQ